MSKEAEAHYLANWRATHQAKREGYQFSWWFPPDNVHDYPKDYGVLKWDNKLRGSWP